MYYSVQLPRFWRKFGFAMGLGLLAMAAMPAFAGGGHGHYHTGAMSLEKSEKMALRRVAHLAKMVQASPEQKQQLQSIATESVQQSHPLWNKQMELRQQKMQLLAEPQIDTAAVAKLDAQISANQSALYAVMSKAKLDSAQVLLPAQRTELLQYMQKHRRKGKKHKRMHGYKHDQKSECLE